MRDYDVARECERKIGLGDFPLVAKRFFARLQRLCVLKGDEPLLIIANVIEESQGAKIRNKNKYFGFTCTRRLNEAGYWELPEADGPPPSPPAAPTDPGPTNPPLSLRMPLGPSQSGSQRPAPPLPKQAGPVIASLARATAVPLDTDSLSLKDQLILRQAEQIKQRLLNFDGSKGGER